LYRDQTIRAGFTVFIGVSPLRLVRKTWTRLGSADKIEQTESLLGFLRNGRGSMLTPGVSKTNAVLQCWNTRALKKRGAVPRLSNRQKA
jgi:hypothetical protein